MCIGQLVGTLVSTISTHYFGRKIAVLASCPPGFMGWILQVNHHCDKTNNLKEACNVLINFFRAWGATYKPFWLEDFLLDFLWVWKDPFTPCIFAR